MHLLRQFTSFHIAFVALLAACAAQGQGAPEQPAGSDWVQALGTARARGCDAQPGTRSPLRWNPQLADAAARVARGAPAADAMRAAGYRSTSLFQISMSGIGSPAAAAQTVIQRYCKPITNPALTDLGVHQQGSSYWVLMAAPFTPPASAAGADVSARALRLVNQARSQPRRCGDQSFGAAGPLRANAVLDQAAAVHAQDMAAHSFLAHEGRDGSRMEDRITRAGYRWRAVGENIAAGQQTADEVVRDWIKSPGHCANLMNPEFTEMGLAFAVNVRSESGIYWAQEFGRPR